MLKYYFGKKEQIVTEKSLKVPDIKCTQVSEVLVQVNYTYTYMYVLYILYTSGRPIIGLVDYWI